LDHLLGLVGRTLVVWLLSLGINLVVYLVATSILIHALRYFWDKGLEQRKIQKREASRADIRREIASSLRTILIFSVIYAAIYAGARANIFVLCPGIQPLGVPYLLASTAAIIVAHETYFYWLHRLMHHRLFFARCHRTHHKSVTPTAYACFAMDPPEAILIGLFVPLWLLVVPMQLPGLSIALALIFARNITAHSGVEFVQPGSRWFRWLATNTDHDLHHATVRYNYGLCFSVWDRLMGTEHPSRRTQRQASPQHGAAVDHPMPPIKSSRPRDDGRGIENSEDGALVRI
jgi:Delta7-sterol 5-desaturase